MLAGKKQEPDSLDAPAKPAAASSTAVASASAGVAPHMSPARALQQRLFRELVQPARPWLWHSAGLVLTAFLALWIAAVMLSAGF